MTATALAMLAGCSASSQDSSQGESSQSVTHDTSPALRRVSLPDLAALAPGVQQQVRDQLDLLARVEADAKASADARAAAFADLGMLLLAAESFADAEACFLNASALNPSDVRWSYYLGHVYRLQGESHKAAGYFERTLQLHRDDVAALVWLGNMYLDQGRSAEAAPLFSRAHNF